VIDDPADNPEIKPAIPGQSEFAPVLAYATPDQYRNEVRREGRYAGVPRGMDLPDRCVICNAPSHIRVPLNFSNQPAGMGHFTRTLTTIHVGFCRTHAGLTRRRFWRRAVTWTFIAVLAAALNFAVRCADPEALPIGYCIGAFALFMTLICLAWPVPPMTCPKSDERALWLNGAEKSFLESLPRDPP